jgi:hypothetical protein
MEITMSKNQSLAAFCFLSALLVVCGLQFFSVVDSRAATKKETAQNAVTAQKAPSFKDAVKAESGPPPAPPQQLSGGSAAARAPFAEVKVEKATGENAYSVAEIFAKSKALNGKMVRVRGKVVRYHSAIMGRNWIHLQDGTGNPMQNTHDLVATSTETATVGEVITVEGKLAADKDFGAGYSYAAIVEGAKVVK